MTTPATSEPTSVETSAQTGTEFVERAWSSKAKGDLESSEADFKRAKELDTNLVDAYYGLGLIYREKGDRDAAVQAFEKVLELIGANVISDQPNRATILKNMTKSQINMLKSSAQQR